MHGDDDSVIPVRNSDRFAQLIKEGQPQTTLRYDMVPGEDHAFDMDASTWASIYEDARDFVRKGWLH